MGTLAWYHRTHPEAFYKPRGSAEDRFWSHVDRSGGPEACWPWTGNKIWSGYGQLREGGRGSRMVAAHRFALQLKLGRPLGPEEQARHVVCDNPPCCNPAHLEPGTNADNMADMVAHERQAAGDRNGSRLHPESHRRGEQHHRALVTEVQVRAIRDRVSTGEVQAQVAASLGLSTSLVSRIVRRDTWSHVR